MANEPDYGVDAPHVILNLFAAGMACGFLALLYPRFTVKQVTLTLYPGFLYSAALFLLPVILMLVYSKAGKFRHRDRILAKVPWRGDESVLDVGAGRGLLLIGAAKRLTTGEATGIDIWNSEDLSGNSPQALIQNIVIEGVGRKADVKSEDARKMSSRMDHSTSFSPISACTTFTSRRAALRPAARSPACSSPAASPSSPTSNTCRNMPQRLRQTA